MSGKEVSFEEQITAIREFIAGVMEEEEDWGEAAKVFDPVALKIWHYCTIDLVLGL